MNYVIPEKAKKTGCQPPLARQTIPLRFIGWFFFANACLFILIGLRYLSEIYPLTLSFPTPFNKFLVSLFIFFTMVGHLSFLAFLPALLVIPFAFLFRKLIGIQIISVCVASTAVFLLIVDTIVFKQFHYHLNGIILQMIISKEFNEIFQLSTSEWIAGYLILTAIFLFEALLAIVTKKIIIKKPELQGKTVATTLGVCLLIAYEMFLLGGTNLNLSLTQQARAFPLFNNFLALILPLPDSLTRVENLASGHFAQPRQVVRPLRYPLHPLHFMPAKSPLNLLIIVVDTWRPDMMTANVMPNVYEFSKKTWQFHNHWSGGNSTQAGIFSLFYGIPGTYWASMLANMQGPVLIKALLNQGYQTGVYASAELTIPAFHRCVFADIPNLTLETPGDTPYQRDYVVTKKFREFLDQNKNTAKPFFSFLFYNSAHAYCMDGNPIKKFQPSVAVCKRYALTNDSDPIPYINRYKNGLAFVDQQVGIILNLLKQNDLLKNTVVIITGDHGQEFNDNHNNYWEHASNYTRYQVQTPLFIYWPHEKPMSFTHWTSHFDISPTLMKKLLGCSNQPEDFCLGHPLLDKKPPKYLIISSYIDFGIVSNNKITTIYATGNYAIHDNQNHLLQNAPLDLSLLREALRDVYTFYRVKQ
jgi:uncharacterized protein